ncbi:MAG: DinB family protein [Actinobacteria bacterium]|nr:DinB family protein [Actinomycetota bacterium]
MTITPDTKDWTWILDRPCPECGFDARSFDVREVGSMVRTAATELEQLVADDRAALRPVPEVWSALEYSAHVRDVFTLYSERLALMLTTDDPLYENWDQDQTALQQDYGSQESAAVASDLREAAEKLAGEFDAVQGDEWERTGRRSDGARFTVESFARYFIHDPIHHVHDIRKGYTSLSA